MDKLANLNSSGKGRVLRSMENGLVSSPSLAQYSCYPCGMEAATASFAFLQWDPMRRFGPCGRCVHCNSSPHQEQPSGGNQSIVLVCFGRFRWNQDWLNSCLGDPG